jgi:hypothetical protein
LAPEGPTPAKREFDCEAGRRCWQKKKKKAHLGLILLALPVSTAWKIPACERACYETAV